MCVGIFRAIIFLFCALKYLSVNASGSWEGYLQIVLSDHGCLESRRAKHPLNNFQHFVPT